MESLDVLDDDLDPTSRLPPHRHDVCVRSLGTALFSSSQSSKVSSIRPEETYPIDIVRHSCTFVNSTNKEDIGPPSFPPMASLTLPAPEQTMENLKGESLYVLMLTDFITSPLPYRSDHGVR